MSRLRSLQRRLGEADFEIEIQYALLGLLLIFQAAIPAMQAAAKKKVPIPGPSLSARVIWGKDPTVALRVGQDIILAENRSGRLFQLHKEFPHSQVAKNFTFRLDSGSSGNLCCWLAAMPDLGATHDLAGSSIRVLIFKSSIANEIERAIDSGSTDPMSLPPGAIHVDIKPGTATNISLPAELLNL